MTRALIAVTGVDHWTLADGTKHPSGYWPEELDTPYRVFTEAGIQITIGTPGAVQPTPDEAGFLAVYHGGSDVQSQRVRDRLVAISRLHQPVALEDVNVDDYDFVFIPGGWGPMEDLAVSESFGTLLRRFHEAGKPVSAVCHGPAALLSARADDGSWLFAGRQVTGFSNKEEHEVGTALLAKWLVEDRLREEGGVYSSAPEDWSEFVVVDGNLYTGQNPSSAEGLAQRLVSDLAECSAGSPPVHG